MFGEGKKLCLAEQDNSAMAASLLRPELEKKYYVQEGRMSQQNIGSMLWNKRNYFRVWAVWKGQFANVFIPNNFICYS
jgi:hypothetical protein